MSNRLDPDQAQHFVGLDLGPNCLQKLSADDTRRQRDIKEKCHCDVSFKLSTQYKPADLNQHCLQNML